MSKMDIWNQLCETDPKYTTPVKFGRGFTAIDPMYQIRLLTSVFGPVGVGWGIEVKDTQFLQNGSVAILIRLWHGSREQYTEQWGQASLYIDKNQEKPDIDCMKKATTDGLTKAASHLGCSADVFLGQFDDNKYVTEMKQKFKEVTPEEKEVQRIVDLVNGFTGKEKLEKYKDQVKQSMAGMEIANKNLIAQAFLKKDKELTG